MNMNKEVTVSCAPVAAGFSCEVRVGDDPGATTHVVTVDTDVLARLTPGATDPERLVAASFRFLLAREPRESILRTFDLHVIGRYFPDFEAEIGRAPQD
jgi:hypothetical protein